MYATRPLSQSIDGRLTQFRQSSYDAVAAWFQLQCTYYYINIKIATPTRTCVRDSHSGSPTPSPAYTVLILRSPSPITHVYCIRDVSFDPLPTYMCGYYITDNCDPRGFQQWSRGYRRITRIYYY